LRIYIDTPDEVCFQRRLQREYRRRGRTPEVVRQQYEATVRPPARFCPPFGRQRRSHRRRNRRPRLKVEQILGQMNRRGLLRFQD